MLKLLPLVLLLGLAACQRPEDHIRACRFGFPDEEAKAWDCARNKANINNQYTRAGMFIAATAAASMAVGPVLARPGPRTFLICNVAGGPMYTTVSCH